MVHAPFRRLFLVERHAAPPMNTPQDKALAAINGVILGILAIMVLLCGWILVVMYR